mmetsp:Transcript_112437/g.305244  ORF Transcript_112437/g.305244 Transcript_112437/m.305244 type:complete len:235 (+) Transcript_112437:847-1551(+)
MLRGGVLRVLHRGAVHPLPDPHGRVVVGGRRSPHPPLLPGQELRHPECRGQQGRHVHVRGVRVLRLVHPDQLVRHPERRGGGPPRRDELVGSAARGRRGRGCEPRGRRGRARRQARGPEAQVRKGLGEQHAGAQQGGRRPEEQNRHPAPDAAGAAAPRDRRQLTGSRPGGAPAGARFASPLALPAPPRDPGRARALDDRGRASARRGPAPSQGGWTRTTRLAWRLPVFGCSRSL